MRIAIETERQEFKKKVSKCWKGRKDLLFLKTKVWSLGSAREGSTAIGRLGCRHIVVGAGL